MGTIIDLNGQKFGRLTIIDSNFIKLNGRPYCKCLCDCGKIVNVRKDLVKSIKVRSCGCLQKELNTLRFRKHGDCATKLHHVCLSMRNRCKNPNDKSYINYGGRGITTCPEWDEYINFKI